MIYYDTETCGFKGPMVLLQYAVNEGPIQLVNIWKQPVEETLELIECMLQDTNCAFNLVFDHFQLCKIYGMFELLPNHTKCPQDYLDELTTQEWHDIEKRARDVKCLKPKNCFDVMLHARKGPYQSTMDRKDIWVKRVPTAIAQQLADTLEELIPLKKIYFSGFKDKNRKHWQVEDIIDAEGEVVTNLKNIVLRFRASSALKNLAVDALGLDENDVLRFGTIGVDKHYYPNEDKYVPYGSDWVGKIIHHINYWAFNPLAKQYAGDDVKYVRELYHYFGDPPVGDADSELAAMVAAVRWKGFSVDCGKLSELATQARAKAENIPTAPSTAKKYLIQHMNEFERSIIQESTKKVVLQEVAKWKDHPAAKAARDILQARQALKEVELYDKLIAAERFHAGFRIIGTKSTRMSGSDGLNPQGIKKDGKVRSCFGLAPDGMILCGGDFDAFEVSLAEAIYNDAELRKVLLSGKKLHALFAMSMYPGSTYEEIMEENKRDEFDPQYVNGTRYKDGKQGVFGKIYGGDYNTMVQKLGLSEEVAKQAEANFERQFPGIAKARMRIQDMFCCMTQPNGIGSQVIWKEPKDYIESIFGFRRYFTLENKICKALYDLAQNPPKEWRNIRGKIIRRERTQTISGATMSGLYAAAFNIQSQNMRAASNHEIQSPGATITKEVQNAIWSHQPIGIHDFKVMPLNIHDEIMTAVAPELVNQVKETVEAKVESYRDRVPLIALEWKAGLKSWGEK